MSQMTPYCFKCGAELDPETIYCPVCGRLQRSMVVRAAESGPRRTPPAPPAAPPEGQVQFYPGRGGPTAEEGERHPDQMQQPPGYPDQHDAHADPSYGDAAYEPPPPGSGWHTAEAGGPGESSPAGEPDADHLYAQRDPEPAYGQPAYDEQGYDQAAYDRAGPEQPAPYEPQAYDQQAYEQQAYEQQAYEQQAYEQPAYEQPAYEQPAYEQQAHEQPAYDEPGHDQSGHDQSGHDRSAYGQAAYGQAGQDQPTYGQPTYGQPTYGQPAYGQPAYGQPAYEQPTYEQATYGQQSPGRSSYGQSEYGAGPYGRSGSAPPYEPIAAPTYTPERSGFSWLGSPAVRLAAIAAAAMLGLVLVGYAIGNTLGAHTPSSSTAGTGPLAGTPSVTEAPSPAPSAARTSSPPASTPTPSQGTGIGSASWQKLGASIPSGCTTKQGCPVTASLKNTGGTGGGTVTITLTDDGGNTIATYTGAIPTTDGGQTIQVNGFATGDQLSAYLRSNGIVHIKSVDVS